MADQSYFSHPRTSMSSSQRYRCVGPARHCEMLTREPACQTAPIEPSAQLSATQPTTMEPPRKRRRTTQPATQHRVLAQGVGHSANDRWPKGATCARMNRGGDDDDDYLYWTPLSAGQSASPAASFWKSGSTGPPTVGSASDQSSEEFSPKSSYSTHSSLTVFSSGPDDSEPFDALGETERLAKIHDLSEKIIAREAVDREAAVRQRQHDAESHGTSPSSQASLGLATSLLMPLALAAGTSARASLTGQPSSSSSSRIEAPVGTSSSTSGPRSTSSFATTAVGDPRVLTSSSSSSGFGPSRRKMTQGVPSRSPQDDDPSFRGAEVRMQLTLVRGRLRLKRERYYNNSSRRRTHIIDYSKYSDTDDDYAVLKEDDPKVREYRGKQCASCSTFYTPLWRDAEDGTPLCNACGIRYRRYKVHCNVCWHIPGKNENAGGRHCKECGAVLHFVFRKSSMP